MTEPGTNADRARPVRQPVLLGLFAGTAVGAGYLLAGVPNVELMTLIVALSGRVLGPGLGFVCGALAASVFSLGSPYGLPVPLLLLAQALGMGGAGIVGGLLWPRRPGYRVGGRLRRTTLAAIIGLLSTLGHEVLTNLAIIGMLDLSVRVVAAGAVPFFLIHVGANVLIFASLFPLLAERLAGLAGPSLVGRSRGLPLLLLGLVTMTASPSARAQVAAPADTIAPAPPPATVAADSSLGSRTAGAEAPPAPRGPLGWQRPLWTPFAPSLVDWLSWYSPLAQVDDGGVAAQVRVLGEGGTSGAPLVTRDGVPLGTGHALADDPWLIPVEGLEPAVKSLGLDRFGGTDGELALTTIDPQGDRAHSAYRGIKGRHESYHRGVTLLTPRAAWRAGYNFEENLDNEGYNSTTLPDEVFAGRRSDGFTGQGKVRLGRLRLMREIDSGNGLWFEFSNGRRTKDELPSLGAGRLEAWDRGAATGMELRAGSWQVGSTFYWRDRDIEWGGRDEFPEPFANNRLLETTRSGFILDLHRVSADSIAGAVGAAGGSRTRLVIDEWQLRDSGSTSTQDLGFPGAMGGVGQTALLTLGGTTDVAGLRLVADAGAVWSSEVGVGPQAKLVLSAPAPEPWWRCEISLGGRAPRSDELLTPLTQVVAGRELVLLPNPDLERERTARAAAGLQGRLVGLDLAVEASARQLRDGITWTALAGESDRGAWGNDLEMTALRLTGRLSRAGRFLGWGRALLEGTWQSFDETRGQAAFLPPTRRLRVHLLWENHFFAEDGILQLALLSTVQGEMTDPWDVTRTYRLPSRTVHDLLLGFRLVGAHLTVGLRNLTGERVPLSAGARSPGQELDLRLQWTFQH